MLYPLSYEGWVGHAIGRPRGGEYPATPAALVAVSPSRCLVPVGEGLRAGR